MSAPYLKSVSAIRKHMLLFSNTFSVSVMREKQYMRGVYPIEFIAFTSEPFSQRHETMSNLPAMQAAWRAVYSFSTVVISKSKF